MKLIAIGDIGSYEVYVDMTREEATRRYDDAREWKDFRNLGSLEDRGITIKEIIVENGVFGAYDIWEES